MPDPFATAAARSIQGYCGDCNKPTDTLPCPHCSGTATAAREAVRRANADLRAMKRIADEWNKLTDAGKKFMLSALSSGAKEAENGR